MFKLILFRASVFRGLKLLYFKISPILRDDDCRICVEMLFSLKYLDFQGR